MRLQKYFDTMCAWTIFQYLRSAGSKYLWRLEVFRCQLPKLGLSCRLKSLYRIFFFLWYIVLRFLFDLRPGQKSLKRLRWYFARNDVFIKHFDFFWPLLKAKRSLPTMTLVCTYVHCTVYLRVCVYVNDLAYGPFLFCRILTQILGNFNFI